MTQPITPRLINGNPGGDSYAVSILRKGYYIDAMIEVTYIRNVCAKSAADALALVPEVHGRVTVVWPERF